jgi:hypothetical protein
MSETEAPRRTITVVGVVAVLASLACLGLMALLVFVTVVAVSSQQAARAAQMRGQVAEAMAVEQRQLAVREAERLMEALKAEKVRRVEAEVRAQHLEKALEEMRRAKE